MARHGSAGNSREAIEPNPVGTTGLLNQQPLQDSFPHISHRTVRELLSDVKSLKNHPIVKDNFPIVGIVAAYVFAVYSVHAFFGLHNKLVIEFYYDWFTRLAAIFSGVLILFLVLRGTYKQHATVNSVAGFLLVFLLAPPFNSTFASYKQTIHLVNNFAWDRSLMRLDYILHFHHHPWRLLQSVLAYPAIIRAIDLLYALWFVFLFLSCLWMAWSKNRRLRLLFFVSTLLVWILLGSCLATIFSSAGPCYYSKVLPSGENPFAPLMSRLDEIHKADSLFALTNQFSLWEAKLYDTWLPFGGISAMPSIHLAMATIFSLLAFNVRKRLGWIFVAYAVLIQVGSIILGWHYAVDGYVGVLLTILIWFAVARFVKRSA
jgi:hypothetical protein